MQTSTAYTSYLSDIVNMQTTQEKTAPQESYEDVVSNLTQSSDSTTKPQQNTTQMSNQNQITTNDEEEESDAEVKSFLESLLSKGALAFLADLNQEKIDKLVQEFRDKLIKERGDNPESLKEIESLVADFKKQLLEKLEESLDNDESNLKISANALFKTLLEMTEPQNSAFSKLLQEK